MPQPRAHSTMHDDETYRPTSHISRQSTIEDVDSDDSEMPLAPSRFSQQATIEDSPPPAPSPSPRHARLDDMDGADDEADTEIDDITEISPPKATYADRTRDINYFFSPSFMKDGKSVRECRRCT